MKQIRFIPLDNCGLHLRESQEGEGESRYVVGKPILFGVRSVNLIPYNDSKKLYEILEPGCITNDLIQRSDVIFNLNHSNMVPDVLGRCRNGKGTLALDLRENFIESGCEMPNTNNANDTLELMKRGDITGMSFAFEDDYMDTENGVSYERTGEISDGKEVWLRHVKRIIGLYDVSIVTHPAYEQTSVATREAADRYEKAIEEQLKREAGEGGNGGEGKGGEEGEEEKKIREQQEREAVAKREYEHRKRQMVLENLDN